MSVVIPVPSAERLPLLFAGLPPVHEVIVVVGPGEDTVLTLPRAARVIRQTRAGVGNAVACGVAAATGDVVVTLPGDASCDPAESRRLVEALRSGADVAEGSRWSRSGAGVADDSRRPRGGATADAANPPARGPGFGNLVLLWFMGVLFGCRPTDPGSGFRAFRRDRADRLGLPRVAGTEPDRGDGRDGETLLTLRSRAAGLRVAEVPVTALTRLGGATLPTGLRALTGEYLERRRGHRSTAAESIVIMTGGTPGPAGTDSGAARGEPGRQRINPPRASLPDRHPAYAQGPDAWPAPNHAVLASRAGLAGFDHPNSGGLGFADRRLGERREPDSRRTGDRRAGGGQGRPPETGHLTAGGRPLDEFMNRRRWRDDRGDADNGRPRTQGRPNLRVINGEGAGSDGSRGHLRPVPRPDQP